MLKSAMRSLQPQDKRALTPTTPAVVTDSQIVLTCRKAALPTPVGFSPVAQAALRGKAVPAR